MPVMLCSEPFTQDPVQAPHGVEVHVARGPGEFLAALPEADPVVGRVQAPHFAAAKRMRWLQVSRLAPTGRRSTQLRCGCFLQRCLAGDIQGMRGLTGLEAGD